MVSDGTGQLILIISAKAQVVRITLEDVRVTGRNTQGVIVWRDREPDDYVASIAVFQESDTQSIKESDSNQKTPSKTRAKASTSEDEEAEINNNDDINENDELISDDINQLDTGNLPENNEEDDEVN